MISDKLDLKNSGPDSIEDADQEKMSIDNAPNTDIELLKNLSSLLADVISSIDDDRYCIFHCFVLIVLICSSFENNG